MVKCNDGTHKDVHLAYDLTTNKWFRLPHAEMIWIIKERTRYKRSHGNDDRTVVSKISTGGVQDNIRSIPYIISAIESSTGDGQMCRLCQARPRSWIVSRKNHS